MEKKRAAESEPSAAPIAKRAKKRPTLSLEDFPKSIFDPEEEKKKEQEEIEKHGGRIRTLPVMAGHWPTHIYLVASIPISIANIWNSADAAPEQFKSCFSAMKCATAPWTFYSELELHVSVAKTFSLRYSEIEAFCKQLGVAIGAAKIGEIFLTFHRWQLLVNDAKTTSFASLVSTQQHEQVLSAIEAVDGVMARFDHPTYYKPAVVHASFAWTPCDVVSTLQASVELEVPLQGDLAPPVECSASIKMLECKVGKVVRSWPLTW